RRLGPATRPSVRSTSTGTSGRSSSAPQRTLHDLHQASSSTPRGPHRCGDEAPITARRSGGGFLAVHELLDRGQDALYGSGLGSEGAQRDRRPAFVALLPLHLQLLLQLRNSRQRLRERGRPLKAEVMGDRSEAESEFFLGRVVIQGQRPD